MAVYDVVDDDNNTGGNTTPSTTPVVDATTLEIVGARLQTPADENGNRTEIHPITDADAVIVDEGDGTEPRTLADVLGEQQESVVVYDPSEGGSLPNHSCLLIQVTSKESN